MQRGYKSMTEREQIVEKMGEAIYKVLGEEGWDAGPEYFEAADAALRVVEAKPDLRDEVIKTCTCGHNGYGKHQRGCDLWFPSSPDDWEWAKNRDYSV